MPSAPQSRLASLPLSELVALRRNPQYLSARQNAALVKSIRKDGFLAPIIVRPKDAGYEILSGNHRVLASREAGLSEIPCLILDGCDDKRAARIAVNMNTVHGDPTPELLAPFLADLDDVTLRSIYIDDAILDGLVAFDTALTERLSKLLAPASLDHDSLRGTIPNCVCKCGHRHVSARKASKSSPGPRKTTAGRKGS